MGSTQHTQPWQLQEHGQQAASTQPFQGSGIDSSQRHLARRCGSSSSTGHGRTDLLSSATTTSKDTGREAKDTTECIEREQAILYFYLYDYCEQTSSRPY